jgi:hypothetical protein
MGLAVLVDGLEVWELCTDLGSGVDGGQSS